MNAYRPFSPHVTIGQDIIFNNSFDPKCEISPEAGFPSIDVDRVTLFKSEQIGSKRVYTAIKEFKLN